jgi:MFS superfamily sulfate permease-like transporter
VLVPGVVVYRLDDRLFFANSTYFRSRVREAVNGAPSPVAAFVFDAEAVTSLDSSGAAALREMIAELAERGIVFALARSRAAFDDQLTSLGLEDVIPAEHRYTTVRSAVLGVSGVDPRSLTA